MSDSVAERKKLFIVSLNPVDYLTLTGVALSAVAMGLMLSGHWNFALATIYVAVIADAFDGVLARKFNLQREFGRYLDGFVDTLDYLVVPAMFLYLQGFSLFYQALILILFISCGFIRLSVFNEVGNLQNEEKGLGYWGAPVFWSALALGPIYVAISAFGKPAVFAVLSVLIPVFSFLMIHNGRYYKFKNPLFMLVFLLACAAYFFAKGIMGGH